MKARDEVPRQNYGLRFLKQHEIKWLTSADTLVRQTAMSLKDRSTQFKREFPSAQMNQTLLRKVYRIHGIKKKAIRWNKTPKNQDP